MNLFTINTVKIDLEFSSNTGRYSLYITNKSFIIIFETLWAKGQGSCPPDKMSVGQYPCRSPNDQYRIFNWKLNFSEDFTVFPFGLLFC